MNFVRSAPVRYLRLASLLQDFILVCCKLLTGLALFRKSHRVRKRAQYGRIVVPDLERTSHMSDDLRNRGPADPSRVNIDDPSEVKYRCKEYGCTAQQLRHAVA